MAVTFAYLALLAAVGIERLAELGISRRNEQRLAARGAIKFPEPHFRWMVLLHAAILVCAAAEVLVLHRLLIPALAAPMLALFILANLLRWWVVRALAGDWTVVLMNSSHLRVVSSGPYRWVRHPNYMGVVAEVFSLPMIHTAWITAIAGTLGYVAILHQRLRLEDGFLLANPAYRLAMGGKPSFLPRLFKRRSSRPAAQRPA